MERRRKRRATRKKIRGRAGSEKVKGNKEGIYIKNMPQTIPNTRNVINYHLD